jgi:hypothetical protein
MIALNGATVATTSEIREAAMFSLFGEKEKA